MFKASCEDNLNSKLKERNILENLSWLIIQLEFNINTNPELG